MHHHFTYQELTVENKSYSGHQRLQRQLHGSSLFKTKQFKKNPKNHANSKTASPLKTLIPLLQKYPKEKEDTEVGGRIKIKI